MTHSVPKSEGVLLVLSSPSGCGKTTVANILVSNKSYNIVRSISATTRKPRAGEVDGRDYFFVEHEEFHRRCDSGEMLEHAEVFGNLYGVPRKYVEDNISKGINTLLVIDWQGAFKLMQMMQEHVVSVFIVPPSMEELRRRLCGRNRGTDSVVETRLAGAAFEIAHCYEYDYVIINEDAEETAQMIGNILSAECLRTSRQKFLKRFVDENFPDQTA
ncbi:guanylate kinase [Candidatus Anaplasma sp. TIGMIC]|uniref:guanylate kinase n=1 Tax=Candidatus Anaplasma sp. TIGMIC TaxID=3020713 RepID=UPI00232C2E31|nr:guanylate kinase [Candidatus Anaplasma sp. TIGMIC]MDB1135147.1 guanylate kinase [Candidatus Anaplasma sp. TIGMIC]